MVHQPTYSDLEEEGLKLVSLKNNHSVCEELLPRLECPRDLPPGITHPARHLNWA